MNCAEDCVRFMCNWLLEHCLEDMQFMTKMFDKTALDRLSTSPPRPSQRISYTDATQSAAKVRLLQPGVPMCCQCMPAPKPWKCCKK